VTAWLRAWWSRLTAGLALVVVASVTGVISYTHVYDLTVSLHQPGMVARLMPFGVDGLIVVGSVVLLQAAPGQTWLGTAVGARRLTMGLSICGDAGNYSAARFLWQSGRLMT
jgi:hypothetical protein